VVGPGNIVDSTWVQIDGHAIEGDDAEHLWLAIKKDGEIEIRDRRGVEHAPELLFCGLHLDGGGRIVRVGHRNKVDGEILGGFAEAGAVVGGVAVAINKKFGDDGLGLRRGSIGVEEILVANNKDALGQAGEFRVGAFNAFDDERSRSSTQDLRGAEAVDVRMVPIQARGLVIGDAKTIFEGSIAGLNRGFQDVVLMADRRDGESVEMEIRGGRGHDAAHAGIGFFVGSVRVLVGVSGGGGWG